RHHQRRAPRHSMHPAGGDLRRLHPPGHARSAGAGPPRRRLRHALGPLRGRADSLAAPLYWPLARRRDLLDLGPALRRGPLLPWVPPNRRSDVRVRSAAGPDHRAAGVRRFGHGAVPPHHALARADAYFRGLIDLPFDPNLHVGSFSFAWHSIFSLVGMIAGSIVSFRAARYLIRDDRIYPFAIAVVIGGRIGRIGDIINGEHHATGCSGLPWCVRYTHPATLGQTDYVHPVAAYDGLVMVIIFVVLVAYWRRVRGRPPESRVYWAYLLLFGGF